MKNNKLAKALLLVLCAILLVCASVVGTLAYLTSGDEVTNTFTVGDVTITLDEAKTDVDGKVITGENAGRTSEGNQYHLIPGSEYTKDPVVHVVENSENCYLFVKVLNNIAGIEVLEATDPDYVSIHEQILANNWNVLSTNGNETVYYQMHEKSTAAKDYKVFESFTIEPTWNGNGQSGDVVITAYAIQETNVATKEAAWNLVKDITLNQP